MPATDPNPIDGHESESHPTEGVMCGYVDGKLSDAESALVEAHLDICAECRRMVTTTIKVLESFAPSDEVSVMSRENEKLRPPAPALAKQRARLRIPRAIPVALAASIAALLLARIPLKNSASDDRIRTSVPGREALQLLAVQSPMSNASVARATLRFVWSRPRAEAERFHFVLSDTVGVPIWTTDTPDTSVTVPDSVVLQPGQSYFWHADAVGIGLTASTRLQRFTLLRAP